MLVILSGIHGVEGLAGSRLQTQLLNGAWPAQLPPDTACLMVHAVNPWGMAWGYRENEDNVDLNRNFRDFTAPAPENPAYAGLHEALALEFLDGPGRETADALLAAFVRERGEGALIDAVAHGQYQFPNGLYYGGTRPTWSHQALLPVLQDALAGCERAAVLDLHTGLGPFGYGMLITFAAAASPELDRALAWYGRSVVAPCAGAAEVPLVVGPLLAWLPARFPQLEVTALALEFGTLPPANDLLRHREVLWLRHHGDRASPRGKAILAAFREHYYPASPDWIEMITWRMDMVLRQTLEAFAD
jgi:hypothetical protein